MSTSRHIDKICCVVLALSLLLMVLFINGEALGIQASARTPGYQSRLFNTERVHTINIVIDDWDEFLDTCESEEYTACSVVIDGEAYKNVGLRAKGNTSLSSVSQMGSDRYSFKIKFDNYDSGKNYHGLDKLCLNNMIQDTTYMKDYLTYQMMAAFGVDSPLCSYVYLTVNSEDWGLYLAVEGIEDGFLQRNYGSNYGQLYKPDSLNFGGGRGNGKEFSMTQFMGQQGQGQALQTPQQGRETNPSPQFPDVSGGAPFSMPGGNPGNMGASDVKLQYIDDDPDSYSNIFENAKTKPSQADKQRLISALQSLSSYENLDAVLDVDEVLRYFVVHNFVVNGDSYTGSMIHNYYLYEKDGQLSMIPWDYNLAFGTFQAGSADSAVNDPIDTVLTDRPMQAWIFSDETYTQQYHTLFSEFLDTINMEDIINHAYGLIAPYVEKDPTKFYTYEEFEAGVQTLTDFCNLRCESIRGQLSGTIPSTDSAQSADGSALIDASNLVLSTMGSMGREGGASGENAPPSDLGGFQPGDSSNSQVPPFHQQTQEQTPNFDRAPLNGADGDAPSGAQVGTNTAVALSMIPLGISIAILLIGLIIAKKFKH